LGLCRPNGQGPAGPEAPECPEEPIGPATENVRSRFTIQVQLYQIRSRKYDKATQGLKEVNDKIVETITSSLKMCIAQATSPRSAIQKLKVRLLVNTARWNSLMAQPLKKTAFDSWIERVIATYAALKEEESQRIEGWPPYLELLQQVATVNESIYVVYDFALAESMRGHGEDLSFGEFAARIQSAIATLKRAVRGSVATRLQGKPDQEESKRTTQPAKCPACGTIKHAWDSCKALINVAKPGTYPNFEVYPGTKSRAERWLARGSNRQKIRDIIKKLDQGGFQAGP
jgi:hypothetical protein